LQQVKTENQILEKQVEEISKKAVNEAENCYRLSDLRTEDLINKFRSTSIKGQEQLKKAKEEHNFLQLTMEQRISDLDNKLQNQVSI